MASSQAAAKHALRTRMLARRRALTPDQLVAAAARLGEAALAVPAIAGAGTVAAYVSVGTEPGTGPAIDALRERGTRVLLPILRADLDLDWAPYDGPAGLRAGLRGTLEPAAAPLGPHAVAGAGAVLVPGLAAGRDGVRLGRGGGSFDRALRRVSPGALVAVVLYTDEVLDGLLDGVRFDGVPAEEHDVPVAAALTPDGLRALGPVPR